MKKLLREMRRREIFRTAGLYVGVSWLVIEAGSVLLPTFAAPGWAMRWLILVAMIGFPVTLGLAWVFDITGKGIVVQETTADASPVPIGGRKMDFAVIGVLTVALIVSVYLNLARDPAPAVEPELRTVLIADFENLTGNALFDGSLEQALTIGIESAPFINTYRRDSALAEALELDLGGMLDEETARLVSVRQHIGTVLAGSIEADGSRLELRLRAMNPASGELQADVSAEARDSSEVLAAINELAARIRKALGEEDLAAAGAGESLTTTSLEAIKHYQAAQVLARGGRDEEAIEYYRLAVEADPTFARAWSGWGLSAFKIGRRSEADEQWARALSLLDRMTERERYRTLGLYYTVVSLNYDKAIESYEKLVEKFPADGAGNNNLAILFTYTAQYERALSQSRKLLEIYPNRILYRANHAQYAVYAGDMETAAAEARWVVENDPSFFKSYMILAIVALYAGDVPGAVEAYENMAATGERGASLASTGLADIALFEGRHGDAVGLLQEGISRDRSSGNERGVATKSVMLAQAYASRGDRAAAIDILSGLGDADGDGARVPAAEILAAAERYDDAAAIASDYRQQLRPTAGAYAALIDGIIAYHRGEHPAAIAAFRQALSHADLWLVRYYLGKAYLAAGYAAEAGDEFTGCTERRSEAGGMFFDDVPTWRYTAELSAWKKQAMTALSAAVE